MAKSEIKGKRYTRKTVTTFDSDRDFDEWFLRIGRPDGQGRLSIGASFDNQMEDLASTSRAVLKAAGLPTATILARYPGQSEWQPIDPERTDWIEQAYISNYLTEKGYSFDSDVGLAAKILMLIDAFKKHKLPQFAYELGVAAQAARTYNIMSADGSKNARRSRKKPWAIAYSNILRNRFPGASFEHCWRRIPGPESPDNVSGVDIYKDGNVVVCEGEELRKSSFRTEYFRK